MRLRPTAPQSLEQSNFYHLVLDIAWFGLALPATARFLQVYAIHLGAGATELSLLTMLPAVILFMSASLGSRWLARHANPHQAVFWPSLIFRLQFLLPALTPFMPAHIQSLWLILSLTIPSLGQGLSSVAFLVMMREAVYDQQMTPLLCRRSLAMNITVGLSGLALGAWLEVMPFPLNYQIMFVLAFALSLVSLRHVMKVRLHPIPQPTVQKTEAKVNPWRSSGFQQVAFITAVIHLGFFSVFALTPLYLVNKMGASEIFMAAYGLAELSAGAVVALVVPRLAARIGNRSLIALSMVGTGIGAMILILAPQLIFTLPAAALTGGSWTAAGIGLFSYFSQTTPAENKSQYTVAYTQVVFAATFFGPMIGSLLQSSGVNLVAVMLIGATLRLLAGYLTQYNALEWVERKLHTPSFSR
jgi:hypothetical protein